MSYWRWPAAPYTAIRSAVGMPIGTAPVVAAVPITPSVVEKAATSTMSTSTSRWVVNAVTVAGARPVTNSSSETEWVI